MVLYDFNDSNYIYSIKASLVDGFKIEDGHIRGPNVWYTAKLVTIIVDNKSVTVSSEEGVIVYKKFWLKKKDDGRARKIIINYYKERLEEIESELRKRKAVYYMMKELYGGISKEGS